MCSDHAVTGPSSSAQPDGPPDWESINLPPAHILAHLTDAHCHPTDLTHEQNVYYEVALGGLAAMATVPEDQDKVDYLAGLRPWTTNIPGVSAKQEGKRKGPKVIACFGYHPWFIHRYTLSPSSSIPSKQEHYHSIFLPSNQDVNSKNAQLLDTLLPFLPDPIPFSPLLDQLRSNIRNSLEKGRLCMLGEVGLDGGARLRWPINARHLYVEKYPDDSGENSEEGHEGWKRLTPFKTSMTHQRAIVEAQLEVAIELGVNVSFHSVSAPGPTMDVLIRMRDKHRTRFTNRINVDLHSAGGWRPAFWLQAEKQLLNLYASPSIFITGRSATAAALIRSISPDRILVESDSHEVRWSTGLVWAATEWVARLKGWRLEDGSEMDWELDSDDLQESEDEQQNEWGAVRRIEYNWARFMKLTD
ncbi:hypothetical protein BCR39DRAFT_573782 [Naematelia encephala]|uniref:Metallo-dependent hydrolase n=1 Tax=Naematelia encephala TaxID=71784 RepID=A0A1Y2BJV1_9TREE|nr:hypothetical protein BCR39DRAFT_573782 [Naematelia encephala]